MSLFNFSKQKISAKNSNSKYREGQEIKILNDGITTNAIILQVFTNTAIIKTKDGECTTCNLSEIIG